MNLFIIGFIFIAFFGTLFHFTYDFSNHNKIVGLFSAVNESTWEHIKIALTPFFFWCLIDGYTYGVNPNYFLSKVVGASIIILVIPIIFYSYKKITKKSILFIDICSFYIAILLGQLCSYFVINANPISYTMNYISLILLFLLFGLYLTLTLAPIETFLFLDPISNEYGIDGHNDIIMGLQELYFNCVKSGTKRIEMRLNDNKRKNIKVGDIIIFLKEPDRKERIRVKVTKLLKYNTFSELINNNDINILGNKNISKKDLLKDLEKYYSINKQKKYGVIGIKFEILE